jgi:hypothetical protein
MLTDVFTDVRATALLSFPLMVNTLTDRADTVLSD